MGLKDDLMGDKSTLGVIRAIALDMASRMDGIARDEQLSHEYLQRNIDAGGIAIMIRQLISAIDDVVAGGK